MFWFFEKVEKWVPGQMAARKRRTNMPRLNACRLIRSLEDSALVCLYSSPSSTVDHPRFGKVCVPPEIDHPQSVFQCHFEQLERTLKASISNLIICARSKRLMHPSYQALCELVSDVVVDDRGYLPSPTSFRTHFLRYLARPKI